MSRTSFVALAALALAACQAPPPPPPTAVGTQPPGDFSGLDIGQWTTTLDLTGQCASPVRNDSRLTVAGNQVTLVNPETGMNARGTIEPDGRFSLTGNLRGQPARFSGLIAQNTAAMVGGTQPQSCRYEVRMTRRA